MSEGGWDVWLEDGVIRLKKDSGGKAAIVPEERDVIWALGRAVKRLNIDLVSHDELLKRARDAIQWLREYASGFETLNVARSGQQPSPEVAAKGDELTALIATIDAAL